MVFKTKQITNRYYKLSYEEKQYLKINKEYRPILLISNSTKLVDIRTNKADSQIGREKKKQIDNKTRIMDPNNKYYQFSLIEEKAIPDIFK